MHVRHILEFDWSSIVTKSGSVVISAALLVKHRAYPSISTFLRAASESAKSRASARCSGVLLPTETGRNSSQSAY
jgi:hypothetical protein